MFDVGTRVKQQNKSAEGLLLQSTSALVEYNRKKKEFLLEFDAVFQNSPAFALNVLTERGRAGAFNTVQDGTDLS